MKKKDSIYQLILSLAYTILGILCFIPDVNFLQHFIFVAGLIILIIGIVLFIRGMLREFDDPSRKILIGVGLIVSIIGVCFSTLVWIMYFVFALILGIILILYGLLGLFIALKDKYGLIKIRIMNIIKSILYLSIGAFVIIDSFNSQVIFEYVLGTLLLINGILGIITYLLSHKPNNIIDIDITNEQNSYTQEIIIDESKENKD